MYEYSIAPAAGFLVHVLIMLATAWIHLILQPSTACPSGRSYGSLRTRTRFMERSEVEYTHHQSCIYSRLDGVFTADRRLGSNFAFAHETPWHGLGLCMFGNYRTQAVSDRLSLFSLTLYATYSRVCSYINLLALLLSILAPPFAPSRLKT